MNRRKAEIFLTQKFKKLNIRPTGRKELEMLYTVHTSFEARDNETGCHRRWCKTEKIEAPDKDTAKDIALCNIIDSGEYSFITFQSQNARASSRK